MSHSASYKLASLILLQEGQAVEAAASGILAAYKDPATGSPRARDVEWIAGREHEEHLNGFLNRAVETVCHALLGADQQYLAIAHLLTSDVKLPFPAMTCARAVHEAVLLVCWLTDPAIKTEERLARTASAFLSSVQGSIPALRKACAGRPHADVNQGLAEVIAKRAGAISYLKNCGFGVQTNNDGHAQNVTFDGIVANIGLKMTDLSNLYTPELSYTRIVTSGAAHSNEWFTSASGEAWHTTVGATILPLLESSLALMQSMLGYVGLPAEATLRSTKERMVHLTTDLGVKNQYLSAA